MVENALRGVVREALARTAASGLPGTHHFYITFQTKHPGTKIPDSLASQYPEDMTIVLEHQFWDLAVGRDERLSPPTLGRARGNGAARCLVARRRHINARSAAPASLLRRCTVSEARFSCPAPSRRRSRDKR